MKISIRKDLAIDLLQGTTQGQYNKIRAGIIKLNNLNNEDVPTYYYITKGWPTMIN